MRATTLEGFTRDFRYAVRGLLRSPLFTMVALVTLAVGSGASTAVFSVVNSVLLEPLPYPDSDELVAIWHKAPGAGGDFGTRMPASASMYFTYAEHNRTFEHIGVWTRSAASVTGIAEPEEVRNIVVSEGVLEALEIPPLRGRALSAADQAPDAPRTAMLSYEYWQRRFGGDPSAVGRVITINSNPVEIIGVMPRGFRIADTATDLIVPFRFDRSSLRLPTFDYLGIARLKAGVSVAEANADIERMLPIWMASWPAFPGGEARFYADYWKVSPLLRPLQKEVIGSVGNLLWIVMGTIAIVLLIACANVANLLLVRAQARERELAVRAALGAGSWHIARVLLLESTALGVLGGIAGLVVAYAGVEALLAMAPRLPRLSEIAIGGRELGFSFGISLVAGLLLGLVPTLRYTKARTAAALHAGGRGSSAGRERNRAQNVLVVGQVALALVLLVTAGLMVRTFDALRRVEPGFTNGAELQTFRITIPNSVVPEPERILRTQNDILDALVAIPSVQSAAFTSSMPMDGFSAGGDVILAEDHPFAEGDAVPPLRRFKYLSPDLLATAGTRLLAGRDFTWTDLYEQRPVVMLSENLARELWSDPAAALGKRVGSSGNWREVVGVVQDVRENGVDRAAPAFVYWPSMTAGFGVRPAFAAPAVTVVLRTPLAGSAALLRQIQETVWSMNPSLPVASMRTMEEVAAQSLARTSFTLVMLGAAGAVALVLGVVGLYGVISYAVAQRRREIAIRMALGAQQAAIRASFVRHGVTLAAIGVVIGLGAAAIGTRLMTSLLYEVRPLDLPTYAAVAIALTLVAAVASYLPARRASRVDPAEALVAE